MIELTEKINRKFSGTMAYHRIKLINIVIFQYWADDVWPRWRVESAEAELSVPAHVIFSCEGRMKVAKTFVHDRVILSLCTASCLA